MKIPVELLEGQLIDLSKQRDVSNEVTGANGKKVLVVLVGVPRDSSLFQYLTKIIAAVDLDIEKDVGLLTLTNDEAFSFSGLTGKMTIDKAVFFNVPPKRAGLNINYIKYQPLSLQNRRLLFADDLGTIQGSKELRLALWNALKAMFKG